MHLIATVLRSRTAPALAALLAGLLAATGARAQVQVQRCQVDGRLVFQSGPCAVAAPARPDVAPARPDPAPARPDRAPARPDAARVADPVTAGSAVASPAVARKKTLADLLHARDGADAHRPRPREFEGDGASVLRARMGAV